MSTACARRSTVEIAHEVREIRRAAAWLSEFCSACGVPQAQSYRLLSCLHEALANVLEHAGEQDAQSAMHLAAEVRDIETEPHLLVTLTSAGVAFDTAAAPAAALPQHLDDATPGGLGLTMLRGFSDHLTYERTGIHNVLTFGIRLEAPAQARMQAL